MLDHLDASGLVRQRLLATLDAVRAAPLAVVVAPAGFGKTTLLAHYASAYPGPVGWLSAAPGDADPSVFATHLRRALQPAAASQRFPAGPTSPMEPADPMDLPSLVHQAGLTADTLLIIDDAHWLETSPAEAALERALATASPRLHILLATRRMPGLNLSRHELDGLVIIDAEQLRFRSWEAERLLREVYREPLPPEDTAALARRMGGWAAGLHMFHLSTRGRPLPERRAAVAVLSGRCTLFRAYLARTVLAELPPELQSFLVHTAVFDVLTAERCDRLLDRSDSQHRLEELARLQAFTTSDDGGRSYRYHEAMRSHLAATLAGELGDQAARDWYAKAGQLLAEEDAVAEAARAYAHAEDWLTVRWLLDRLGPGLVEGGVEPWRDLLPAWLVADDPWMVVAEGQHLFSGGQLAAAIECFERAEGLFSAEDGRAHCRRALARARTWLPGPARTHGHWTAWLRAATQRHPALVAESAQQLVEPEGRVVRVVAYLLAGEIAEAWRLLRDVDLSQPGVAGLALRCLHAAGEHERRRAGSTRQLADAAAEAERSQVTWLARMVRAADALDQTEQGAKTALSVADECVRDGDRWGAVVAAGLAWLSHAGRDDVAPAALADLVRACRQLDAGVLEAWASALHARAAAAAGLPDADLAADQAATLARSAGVPGTRSVVWPASGGGARPSVEIRCLGGFRTYLDGGQVDWSAVRPRARTLMRLLALHTGRPVHREVLVEALWPDRAPAAATHNLHVALSSLRKLLEPRSGGGRQLLVRDGDAYCLVLPADGYCDVVALDAALDEARRARLAAGQDAMVPALRTAVAAYGGELLPEDGAAEWVSHERERLRQGVAGAAVTLATFELDRGDSAAAVAMAERCLSLDRYHDEAWRVLVRAYQQDGNWGAARRSAERYAAVLAELGLDPQPALDTAGLGT